LMRSKKGVRNAYKAPDVVNQIDWSGLRLYPEVYLYVRGLIKMRNSHKVFRMGSAEQVRRNLHFTDNSRNMIVMRLDGSAVGDEWKLVYVIINPNNMTLKWSIPNGEYIVVCRGGKVNANGICRTRGGNMSIGRKETVICVAH